MPQTYEPIATQTVSGSASSVSFTSIPSTYTHLRVIAYGYTNGTGNPAFTLNGAGTFNAIYNETLYNAGAQVIRASAQETSRGNNLTNWFGGATSSSTNNTYVCFDVYNYASSLAKTGLCRMSSYDLGSSTVVSQSVWSSDVTAAVSTLQFTLSGTWSGMVTIYGIKGA